MAGAIGFKAIDDPRHWTDDDVKAYLLSEQVPLESWRVGQDGGYGFVSNNGTLFACADDWEERAIRVAAYLTKIGAPSIEEAAKQSGPLSARMGGMDDPLAEIKKEVLREQITRDSMRSEVCNRHRQFLDALSSDELRRHGNEVLSRHIEDTMDLSASRETRIEMLVGFYYEDDIRHLSDAELVAMLVDFDCSSP